MKKKKQNPKKIKQKINGIAWPTNLVLAGAKKKHEMKIENAARNKRNINKRNFQKRENRTLAVLNDFVDDANK